MLFILRDGHRSGALGCRRNIARFISSSIVFGLVRILFIYLGMFLWTFSSQVVFKLKIEHCRWTFSLRVLQHLQLT